MMKVITDWHWLQFCSLYGSKLRLNCKRRSNLQNSIWLVFFVWKKQFHFWSDLFNWKSKRIPSNQAYKRITVNIWECHTILNRIFRMVIIHFYSFCMITKMILLYNDLWQTIMKKSSYIFTVQCRWLINIF